MKFKNDKQRKAVMANLSYGRSAHAIAIDKAIPAKQKLGRSAYASSERNRTDYVGFDYPKKKEEKKSQDIVVKGFGNPHFYETFDDNRYEMIEKVKQNNKKYYQKGDALGLDIPLKNNSKLNPVWKNKLPKNEDVRLDETSVLAKFKTNLPDDRLPSAFMDFISTAKGDAVYQIQPKINEGESLRHAEYLAKIKTERELGKKAGDYGAYTNAKRRNVSDMVPSVVVWSRNGFAKFSPEYLKAIEQEAGKGSKMYLTHANSPLYVEGKNGYSYIIAPKVE